MSNMVVQTNVLALNAHRNMKGVGGMQEKASARLASGYRINSAADDAAGLAISEKMRSQIRGLDMASKNAQDAISLIQTAEGGMQEIDNMVQRIRELVVYAANDTLEADDNKTSGGEGVSQGDRQKIQDEINSLAQEIDSMADRVEFNRKKLIDGSLSKTNSSGIYFQVGANKGQGWSLNINSVTMSGLGLATASALHKQSIVSSVIVRSNLSGTNAVKQTSGLIVSGLSVNVLQGTGATASGLSTTPSRSGITDQLQMLDKALSIVTTERSKLGAAQNRLEYTIKSLDISSENLSQSESRIRDTDMAKEMMQLTKANVLQQSTISILSQANQNPMSLMALLR